MKDDVTNEQFLTMDFKSFTCALLRGKYYIKMGGIQILNPMYKSQVESYLKNFTHDFDVTPTTHVLKWLNDLEFLKEVTAECVENTHPDIGLLEYAKSICKTNDSSRIAEKKPFCFMDIEIPRTWKNGQYGYMVADSNRYVFMEYRMNDVIHDEKPTLVFNTVADKFVGYWLQHRIGYTKETFENYFQVALKHYVDTHQSELDSWRRNLDDEFIMRHVEDERKYFDNCKLFDYLTKDERQKIKCYFDHYIEWFISLRRCPQNRNSINSGTIEPVKYDIAKHQNYIKELFDWFLYNGGKPKDFTFDNLLQCCKNADFSPLAPKEDFTPNVGLLCYFIVYLEKQLNIGQTWRSKCAKSIGKSNTELTKNKPGKNWTDYPRNNSRLTEGSTKK